MSTAVDAALDDRQPNAKVFISYSRKDMAFADQLEAALRARGIEPLIDRIRKHTEFGEAARRWAAAGRPRGLLLRSPVLEEAERWIAARPESAPAATEETQTYIAESRRGATRRRNILTGSLVAGLMVALVLAGLAYWQRGIAVQQRGIALAERDRATRNFGLAKRTADSLV